MNRMYWIKPRSNISDLGDLTYSYTNGAILRNELILLVHGWEGHSGNFADIITRLVHEGYYVLAFDLSHLTAIVQKDRPICWSSVT